MQIVVQDITPGKAAEWLKKNAKNRKLNTDRVSMYAQDMEAGRWAANGTPIVFSADGEILKDGQHRLTAVVKSGVTLRETPIMFIDNENAVNYDIGLVRSVADLATLQEKEGVFYRDTTMRSAFMFLIMRHLGIRNNRVISKSLILETMINNQILAEPVMEVVKRHGSKPKIILPGGGVAAVLAAYSNQYDLNEIIAFHKAYSSGFPDPNREQDVTPIALRNYALSHFMRGRKEMENMYLQTQYALALYAKKEKRKVLRGLGQEDYYKMKWIVEP